MYVVPELRIAKSIDELNKEHRALLRSRRDASINGLLEKHHRIMVVGEPGAGKTRLLKEFVLHAAGAAREAAFVDLKSIEDYNALPTCLEEGSPTAQVVPGSSPEQTEQANQLRTSRFTLPRGERAAEADEEDRPVQHVEATADERPTAERVVVCLDALDEVARHDLSKALESIALFCRDYPRVAVVVSCRTHHLERFATAISSLAFTYVEVLGLSDDQKRQFLSQDSADPAALLRECSPETQRVLEVPRYMRMFVELGRAVGFEKLRGLTRSEIFEAFIYRKLREEAKKVGKGEEHKVEAITRALEALALVMEIQQANVLPKEDLVTFFDDVQSNLAQYVWKEVTLADFVDRTVLKTQASASGGDAVEFECREFQEYLAAKELSRLGQGRRTHHIVYDLMVSPGLSDIIPSWYNTLSFLLDREPDLLPTIMRVGSAETRVVQPEDYHRLVMSVRPERLSPGQRRSIFKQVLDYYATASVWLPIGLPYLLARYSDPSLLPTLERLAQTGAGEALVVNRGNVANLVGALVREGRLERREALLWEERLVGFIKDSSEESVFPTMQRECLHALREFNDLQILKSVEQSLHFHRDTLLLRTLVSVCGEIDPEADVTLDLVCRAMQSDDGVVEAFYVILAMKSQGSVVRLLSRLADDSTLLREALDHSTLFDDRLPAWARSVAGPACPELDAQIAQFVRAVILDSGARHYGRRSPLLTGLVGAVAARDPKYVAQVVSMVVSEPPDKWSAYDLYDLRELVTGALTPESLEPLVAQLRGRGDEHEQFASACALASESPAVLAKAKELFPAECAAHRAWADRNKGAEEQRRVAEARKVLAGFIDRLHRGDQDRRDLFSYYMKHEGVLRELASAPHLTRLRELATGYLERVNPSDAWPETKWVDARAYTRDSWTAQLPYALRTAISLGVDVSQWRAAGVSYVPLEREFGDDGILSMFSPLTDHELDNVAGAYEAHRDLRQIQSGRIVSLAQSTRSARFGALLRELVAGDAFHPSERVRALEVMVDNAPDAQARDYLGVIFTSLRCTSGRAEGLRDKANELLIRHFRDPDAIGWRLAELVRRAFPFTRDRGSGRRIRVGSSAEEDELRHFAFARPIMELAEPAFQLDMLDLMGISLDMSTWGDDYDEYSTYLRTVVVGYFDGLKRHGRYEPIDALEQFIRLNATVDDIRWFRHRLVQLRQSYMAAISKPRSVRDCVVTYNDFRTRSYLDVADARDLHHLVCEVLDVDVRNWIEAEGAYAFLGTGKVLDAKRQQYENLIQRTVKAQIRAALLARGLRDVNIIREQELDDGRKLDFVIWQGFVGPVVIELKLTSNTELRSRKNIEDYRSTLVQRYMQGVGATYGVFVLLQVDEQHPLDTKLQTVREVYATMQGAVAAIGFKCCA
ncbi:MAG: hypothetical protein M9894_17685 [Planctomycetes bacterium]|nr:hypothetical protein [Planctomycetota bacterium]